MDWEHLTKKLDEDPTLHLSGPASDDGILRATRELGRVVPDVVKRFWRVTNGLHSDSGVLLYSTRLIAERNDTLGVTEYAPEFVAVGDNSGGRVFLMEASAAAHTLYDADDSSPEARSIVAASYLDWLADGCPLPEDEEEDWSRLGEVVVTAMPPGGLRDLARMRRELALPMGLDELRRLLAKPPATVLHAVTYAKYRAGVDALGELAAEIRFDSVEDDED